MYVKDTQIGALKYSTPTVHLIEVTKSPVARATATNVIGFVGQFIRGEVGKAYRFGSLLELEKKLGGYKEGYDGYLFAKNIFDANGGTVKAVRVASSGTASATVLITNPSNTLFTITADTVGTWGNSIRVEISSNPAMGYFNMVVRNIATQEIRQYIKVTTDELDKRYIKKMIDADGNKFFKIVMAISDGQLPDNQTFILTGGSDGVDVGDALSDLAYVGAETGGVRTGIQQFKTISNEDVQIIVSARSTETINSGLIVHVNDIKIAPRRTIISLPVGASIEDYITYRNTLDSDRVKVLFNNAVVKNPFTNEDEIVSRVSFEAGNDSLIGYHQSASQTALPASVIGLEYDLTEDEVDQLTENQINPVTLKEGRGFIRRSDYTISSNPTEWQNVVRKGKDFFSRAFYDFLQFFISKPITAKLWSDIREGLNSLLRIEANAVRIGKSDGGTPFFVKVDSENNPTDLVELNRIRVDAQISLLAVGDVIELYLDASQENTITG